jgi:predicted DNA-binding transcriptional regulator AlpA
VQTTDERLWSLQETADFLGVPEATLYQWASRGIGPRSLRVGRHRRYRPAQSPLTPTAEGFVAVGVQIAG